MTGNNRQLSAEELDAVTGAGIIDDFLGLAGAAFDHIKGALTQSNGDIAINSSPAVYDRRGGKP